MFQTEQQWKEAFDQLVSWMQRWEAAGVIEVKVYPTSVACLQAWVSLGGKGQLNLWYRVLQPPMLVHLQEDNPEANGKPPYRVREGRKDVLHVGGSLFETVGDTMLFPDDFEDTGWQADYGREMFLRHKPTGKLFTCSVYFWLETVKDATGTAKCE